MAQLCPSGDAVLAALTSVSPSLWGVVAAWQPARHRAERRVHRLGVLMSHVGPWIKT